MNSPLTTSVPDYREADELMEKLIEKVCVYMPADHDRVYQILHETYIFARDAHE